MKKNDFHQKGVWIDDALFKKVCRMAKLIGLFMLISFVAISAGTYSQNTRFSFKIENGTLNDLFLYMEQNSNFRFAYNKSDLDDTQRISYEFKNESVEKILNKVLDTERLSISVKNEYVIITSNGGIQDSPFYNNQAFQTISGKVSDSSGSSLPGVTVVVKGTTQGTITDGDGNYSLPNVQRDGTLVFSFVGMRQQEILVGNQSTINLVMEEEAVGIEEVVAIGYGTQRKRDITGAISNIDVEQLKDVPATNVQRLIVGQAPGVVVKQTSGTPGSEAEIVIRGLNSLGAGSAPLYVVDGFPIGTTFGQNLNPNDIESITILKDAVSTAIYGARGSNGVILITTKNAKEGKVSLNVSANYGIQNIPDSRKTKVLNGQEFAQFKKDAYMDKIRYFENREPSIDEVPLDFRNPEQTEVSTNWYDAILNQNAKFQNYNITLSEGNGDIHSMVSVGVINQEGAIIETNYNQYSVRANISGKVNDFINMGLNINGSYSDQDLANSSQGWTSILGATLLMDPREPIYNEDGSYNDYIGGHDGIFGWANPVQYLSEIQRSLQVGDLLSNGFLEFSFLKNFKFKSTLSTKLNYQIFKNFVPSTVSGTNAPAPRDATENDSSTNTQNYSTDQLLTYENEFKDHKVNILAGFTAQEENIKVLSGTGSDFSSDETPYLGSAAINSSTSSEYGWSMYAYFSRLNYSYKDKYLFSGTFRREGSSRFGANNKFGNFPAMSVGWRILEESFIPEITWLNDLKVRASWGITGNNNIGNYSSIAYMSGSNYILGSNLASGYVVNSFANADLGWERSKQLDIGLDLSAFNNKLTFNAEYYKKITSDMLLSVQLPAISGFTSSLSNIGKVQNKGFEFALGYKTKVNDFIFRSNFNISLNRNEVLEIRGENDEIWTGDFYDGYNVSRVGRPIGMMHGFKVLGIFQTQEEIDDSPTQDGAIPGVYKYYDATDDGQISYNTDDMVEIGNPWPKYTWGLTLGGDYKNFDFSLLFTSSMNYDIVRRIETSTMNMDGVFNVLVESKDRWRSVDNPGSGKYATTNTWKWEREANSRYVYDGSHVWVKNISLGYTIPQSKSNLGNVRFYLSADNLFLITNYPGNNPDINNRGGINPGFDDEAYPVARTFSIGANITF